MIPTQRSKARTFSGGSEKCRKSAFPKRIILGSNAVSLNASSKFFAGLSQVLTRKPESTRLSGSHWRLKTPAWWSRKIPGWSFVPPRFERFWSAVSGNVACGVPSTTPTNAKPDQSQLCTVTHAKLPSYIPSAVPNLRNGTNRTTVIIRKNPILRDCSFEQSAQEKKNSKASRLSSLKSGRLLHVAKTQQPGAFRPRLARNTFGLFNRCEKTNFPQLLGLLGFCIVDFPVLSLDWVQGALIQSIHRTSPWKPMLCGYPRHFIP